MPRAAVNLQSLARVHTETCIRTLALLVAQSENDSVRVAAIAQLLDRGWGKAPQSHTGENGEGGIRVVIRHIIEGRDAPRIVDAKPVPIDTPKDRSTD